MRAHRMLTKLVLWSYRDILYADGPPKRPGMEFFLGGWVM